MSQESRHHHRPIFDLVQDWDGESELSLDDEQNITHGVRFAVGALDGIQTHHGATAKEPERKVVVDKVVDAISDLLKHGDDNSQNLLYEQVHELTIISFIDPILDEVRRHGWAKDPALRHHARWLVRYSTNRAPLKLGIALLGLCGNFDDIDDLLLLARCDEFTLYCAVAVRSLAENPLELWWNMAKNVHGWGRIHMVERLAECCADRPDLRGWLLREGYKNSIMNEYTAYSCAVEGKMLQALKEERDDLLIDSACDILGALLEGGPAKGIAHWSEGAAATDLLLGLVEESPTTLTRLYFASRLADWLDVNPRTEIADDTDRRHKKWLRLEALDWTLDFRNSLQKRCLAVLQRPDSANRILIGYQDPSESQQWLAWGSSTNGGVDLWELAFRRLQTDRFESRIYWQALETSDPDRLEQVFTEAERRLPLNDMATGPIDEVGVSKRTEPDLCLGYVLQRMRDAGPISSKLVAAGLRSAVVSNRNMALNVIENRTECAWADNVITAFRQARSDEVRDKVKERLNTLAPLLGL